jgi:hypothetical protein|tara:strand:- start:368 stop:592 length:225 start_codon:yes stop_codon:yes gene_type:complete
MSKKYFNPNSKTLSEWDSNKDKWITIALDESNIDEFLFLRDYIEAEMQIESFMEMQLDDYEINFENFLKKRLKN